MSGIAVVLGGDRSPYWVYMQVAGHGQRIAAKALRNAIAASPSLHDMLLRYVHAFIVQASHIALASARGKLDERLARWILMADDRIRRDMLPLTHELLGGVLSVRRAGVTKALDGFESRGLLQLKRGRIEIADRGGIEQVAGRFYGAPEAEYFRLFSP